MYYLTLLENISLLVRLEADASLIPDDVFEIESSKDDQDYYIVHLIWRAFEEDHIVLKEVATTFRAAGYSCDPRGFSVSLN